MKLDHVEETLYYEGLHKSRSKCGLNIFQRGEKIIVIFSELPDNPGTSITNFIEHLATMVYRQKLSDYPVKSIRWFEHYPRNRIREETLDEVFLDWNGERFYNPRWKRVYRIV